VCEGAVGRLIRLPAIVFVFTLMSWDLLVPIGSSQFSVRVMAVWRYLGGTIFMYGKILVPIDDISSAGLALDQARDLAKSNGASVVVMHVVTPDNPLLTHDEHMAGVHAAPQIVEMAQKDEKAHFEAEKAEIQPAIDSLDSEGVETSLLVISGNAHNEIVRVVNEQGVDLVILSTHGRRGVSRALLGSVADEVVHDVGVPVMIVRRS